MKFIGIVLYRKIRNTRTNSSISSLFLAMICSCVCVVRTNLDFTGEGCHASVCAISRYVCMYYVPQCMGVFNQLQKHRQEYIRNVLGYICDVPQFL